MPIHILSDDTISKIAAGEVVERPMNVAKELIENSIDAGATAVTCEIRDGGISFLRVSDNGCGIKKDEIVYAFYRHATSKIDTAADLHRISSLGFRGEALSSIAAVADVEMITRCEEETVGVHVRNRPYSGRELEVSEAGAPRGTTVIVRDLFTNVPVRRKFLKRPQTEAAYITDMIQQFALSHPEISFHYRVNGQEKLHTTGNGSLKEVIYRIFGKETMDRLIEVTGREETENGDITIRGYAAHPQLTRSGRSQEFFYVNGRILKNDLLSKALEEGYGTDLMQHRFPFAVLNLDMDPALLDINVHPSKMEIRFVDPEKIYTFVKNAVRSALGRKEKITEGNFLNAREESASVRAEEQERIELFRQEGHVEPFEKGRSEKTSGLSYELPETGSDVLFDEQAVYDPAPESVEVAVTDLPPVIAEEIREQVPVQQELPIFSKEKAAGFRIAGQVFSTYWIIETEGKMLMIDQHAAHEKVHYERIMKRVSAGLQDKGSSQLLSPPAVVHLTGRQEAAYERYRDTFEKLGFELESFGENAFAMRAVPAELFGASPQSMLLDTLDEILDEKLEGTPSVILQKVASMSCKAAVKGGNLLSFTEAAELIEELLGLDDPYHCPHGRPTMVVFGKDELERKFKRTV